MDKHRALKLLGVHLLLGLATACGQEDPEAPPVDATPQPYHPLVPGSYWDYAHSDWTERVTLEAGPEFEGRAAFVMSDSPNPSDDLRSDSIIVSEGGRIVRKTKEEFLIGAGGAETATSSVTYGVGFTRFNEDWANQPVGFKETPEYVRVETPPGEPAKAPEDRRHTFEVISLHEDLTAAGRVFDCIVIRRTKDWEAEEDGVDLSDAQTKTFWFARGVGKVQELNEESGNTERLVNFVIPTGGATTTPGGGY